MSYTTQQDGDADVGTFYSFELLLTGGAIIPEELQCSNE